MYVIRDIANLSFNKKIGIVLGNFDGVHLGHVSLIKNLKNITATYGYKSLVFTFDDHTLKTLDPSKAPSLLTTRSKKVKLITDLYVDYLVMVKFNKEFSMMSDKDFIKNVLVDKLNVGYVIIGSDFRFGNNGEGNVETLKRFGKKYNYEVKVVPPVMMNGVKVSSSYIRELIKDGKVDIVPDYLGRYYSVEGSVIKGNNYGSTLTGYPTANLKIDRRMCLPPNGVYISRTFIDGTYYPSVTDIGFNPTFHNKNYSIETNILDNFNMNLYGKHIEVEFLKFIRNDIEFKNITLLKEKIASDIDSALNYFHS
jgi:riboflavin kinase/FMN adenylyltransferase